MSEKRVERRLAAILAADVAGYSRMMGADEEGTLTALTAIHRELGGPKISEHRGRIVKTTGDGMLVEFPSVVDAVRCAVEMQREIGARNTDVPVDKRIEFRIGINLGDIIIDEGDIYGDGVNIAARLEALAEPGGICVSRAVRDQVHDKLDFIFKDWGEQQVKNIARPVHVFEVGIAAKASALELRATAPLVLPDKPSLAVLAFVNMSSDPEQEYFADGIAEDIITALSRYPSLFVIARNSSFTYKGRAVDVKKIGRDLGVRYVLVGSLRKSGSQIRVTAQLIEAESGNHLWAERYDRGLADIFAVQDHITAAVTISVAPAIDAAERRRALRRPPRKFDAWAVYQQGLWHRAKSTPTANDQARALFERAIQLDPMFADAHAALARVYGYAGVHYRTIPIDEALRLNLLHARKAEELDPGNADALSGLSLGLIWQGDLQNALANAQQAIAINPNCAFAHLCLGACLVFTGQTAEGRAALNTGERLSPRDENSSDLNRVRCQSYYFDRDYDQCIAIVERELSAHGNSPLPQTMLARALGQLGRTEKARAALDKAMVSWGDYDPHIRLPYHRPEDHEHLLEGLRKAGWER
jgi:adenylate cyclase